MRINLPFYDSLISGACRRVEGLQRPGGALEQAVALAGLAKALADGVAAEVQRRLPARLAFAGQRRAAPQWTPPRPLASPFPPPAQTVPMPVDGYDAMTVVALKDEARRQGVVVVRRVKKSALIDLLRGA
jgi:hypothetical protein